MAKSLLNADWSSRVNPIIERYRTLVPFIGQEEAVLAMEAVGRMIMAVEKAKEAGSNASASKADDAIVQAGKLLEAVGDTTEREPA